MALDPQLFAQMAQTVSVAASSGVSDTGQPAYAAATSLAARVEPERRVMNKANGDAVTSTHRIYTRDQVRVTDRVWMPGDSAANAKLARVPLGVDAITAVDGTVDHYETVV
jgi:hypothetical protein